MNLQKERRKSNETPLALRIADLVVAALAKKKIKRPINEWKMHPLSESPRYMDTTSRRVRKFVEEIRCHVEVELLTSLTPVLDDCGFGIAIG